ncbi:unnamed protein product, partial [Meganyctiphanes norvegica]
MEYPILSINGKRLYPPPPPHNPDDAVLWAIQTGDTAALDKAIDSHANLRKKVKAGDVECTALHLAAKSGNVKAVKLIIKALDTGDMNAQDSFGETAVHWAARADKDKALEALIEGGCSVEVESSDGTTPIKCAVDNHANAALKRLIKRMAQL